jgi:calcineurin-like phosphoesterase family protein
MSRKYFISDLHFGHQNMAIRRGFKDHFEMDEYIIKNGILL